MSLNLMNNKHKIIKHLEFDSEDEFYFLQIMQRRKEHPDLKKNSKIIKIYYIKSIEDLNDRMEEITTICDTFRARAYINLNRRSFKKIAIEYAKNFPKIWEHGNFHKVRNLYNSMCGSYSSEPNKKWIVDIDFTAEWFVKKIKTAIYDLTHGDNNKVIPEIPTPNGIHLICSPFRSDMFEDLGWDVEIKKDDFTILYYKL